MRPVTVSSLYVIDITSRIGAVEGVEPVGERYGMVVRLVMA
jgi:hypothetical protein